MPWAAPLLKPRRDSNPHLPLRQSGALSIELQGACHKYSRSLAVLGTLTCALSSRRLATRSSGLAWASPSGPDNGLFRAGR